jgi:hypothetical protein
MPIKINLLAEAQIVEDLRRRDPVKRAIFAGLILVVLALVWSSSQQLKVVINKSELNRVESKIQARTNEWQTVLDNQKKISDARVKLDALQKLSAARFLQGNLLNGLQQLNFDGVQLADLKVSQTYFRQAATSAKEPADSDKSGGKSRPAEGRAATTTEKIIVTLDARDVSASPGDQVNKFKENLAGQEYFKTILNKTNSVQLTSLSPLQIGTDGKAFELFTLECALPQKTR